MGTLIDSPGSNSEFLAAVATVVITFHLDRFRVLNARLVFHGHRDDFFRPAAKRAVNSIGPARLLHIFTGCVFVMVSFFSEVHGYVFGS